MKEIKGHIYHRQRKWKCPKCGKVGMQKQREKFDFDPRVCRRRVHVGPMRFVMAGYLDATKRAVAVQPVRRFVVERS